MDNKQAARAFFYLLMVGNISCVAGMGSLFIYLLVHVNPFVAIYVGLFSSSMMSLLIWDTIYKPDKSHKQRKRHRA